MTAPKPLLVCLSAWVATSAFAQQQPRYSDIEKIGIRDINRGTVNFYSPEKEIALGRQLSAEFERQVKLDGNLEFGEYINRLGQNIVINSDARRLPFMFKVVDSQDLGAEAFLGGFIYINRGAILALDNEAELAFMLAQQVAHIAARHATERASKTALPAKSSVPLITGDALAQAKGMLVPMQLNQFARQQVMEADLLAVEYLYKAGYAPAAAITFLQKLAAIDSRNPVGASKEYSPIPPAADRIKAMQSNIGMILPPRTQNVVTTPEFDNVKAGIRNR